MAEANTSIRYLIYMVFFEYVFCLGLSVFCFTCCFSWIGLWLVLDEYVGFLLLNLSFGAVQMFFFFSIFFPLSIIKWSYCFSSQEKTSFRLKFLFEFKVALVFFNSLFLVSLVKLGLANCWNGSFFGATSFRVDLNRVGWC